MSAVEATNGAVFQGKTWAIAYAKKTGVEILADDGTKIKVKATAVGNMHAPDAKSFRDDFLAKLTPGDTVISPAGPNYTFLAGAYAACQQVYWIDPGKLAARVEAETPDPAAANGAAPKKKGRAKKATLGQKLLSLFKDERAIFYEYQPTDAKVTGLRLAVQNWLGVQDRQTADGNAYAQFLRREQAQAQLSPPDRAEWVKTYVTREKRRFVARAKASGVTLTKEQLAAVALAQTERAEEVYTSYFSDSAKAAQEAIAKLAEDRSEWFGGDELEDDAAQQVKKILLSIPENSLFDGLIGPDAIRSRALILAYIRNPRFYPCFPALAAYAGIGKLVEGQAQQRRRGERMHGSPAFKKAVVFDFADKYWMADPIGVISGLYYLYKAHQYLTYMPLIELTRELWEHMGIVESEEGEEVAPEADEMEDMADKDGDWLKSFIDRLAALGHLSIIQRSSRAMKEIEELQKKPDAARLWRLFARGDAEVDGKTVRGGNLQMPPKRIEQQTRRFLGTVLLQTIYYRWLVQLGEPLPLDKEYIYGQMWKGVYGADAGPPTEHSIDVVQAYYQQENLRLRKDVVLPLRTELVLIKPDAREAWLRRLTEKQAREAILGLTEKDQNKFKALLWNETPAKKAGAEKTNDEDVAVSEGTGPSGEQLAEAAPAA